MIFIFIVYLPVFNTFMLPLNEEDYPEEMITWNASSLLAGASIKKGTIQYSYSPQMKSILSSLDIYGRINLFVQAKFNSTYSLVLYENCVRFKNIKQTSWFPVELFRSLMGVPKEKYRSFKEFKRNVINVAVKEINQKADISVEATFKKSGRNIVAVQFLLSDNENYRPTFKKLDKPLQLNSDIQKQSILLEKLMSEFNLSSTKAKELIKEYDDAYLIEKINLVQAKKNVKHLGAYLLSAIENDFKDKNRVTKIEKIEKENSYLREAKEASEIAYLKNRYMSYKLNAYVEFVKQQEKDVQEKIEADFMSVLKTKREVYNLYKKKGLQSPFVMSEYLSFIDRFFPEVIRGYLSFDDYITEEA